VNLLDLGSAALVIVDMQYGDAHRDWGLLSWKRDAGDVEAVDRYARRLEGVVVPNIKRLQAAFRAGGGEVVFVRIESMTQDGRERSAEHKKRGIHFLPGSKEGQILSEIAPAVDELVLSKTCGSAFRGTPMEYVLRNMGRTQLVVVGVVTGSCVQATTSDAVARGFSTVVVDDATATWSDDLQSAALEIMASAGAAIASTDAVLASVRVRESRRA
jgi:nicotinamidase-related amidase